MFTVLIVAAAIALVFLMFNKPKPPTSGPTPAPVFDFSQLAAVRTADPVPDRRMQLISKRLQDVEDERLTNDAIDDLIGTRPKPAARSAPAAS